MARTTLDWDGPSWEEHCLHLLRLRYKVPGQFERVPAADQGDLGIEGFSHDGCAYQCYEPEGALPIKERYERQRDKLTEDLAKLEKKQADLLGILGGVVIRTYVFMTPIHDSKRLNGHAKAKAEEVRAKNLPHCDPHFDVVIHTEDDYMVERAELISLGLEKWHLASVAVPEVAVRNYVDSNPAIIATIDDKLSRIPDLTARDRSRLRSSLLRSKLVADNKLDEIRGHHAVAWEHIQGLRSGEGERLEIECLLSQAVPADILRQTAHNYRDTLKDSLAFLTVADASDLAWGTATDWLAECPLDFRVASGA